MNKYNSLNYTVYYYYYESHKLNIDYDFQHE